MIRIISGWSNIGGSTIAFINMCNAFNEVGIPCIFYGPHRFHLNKCKSDLITSNTLQIEPSDILIFHFRIPPRRPQCSKMILSCHETNVFEISKINYQIFDKIHFVSQHQKNYHNVNHPSFIIPNILNDLKANAKISDKVAGIVGSIDRNKQVDKSILRALADGFADIRIFGAITDLKYWENDVKHFVDGNKVKYMGVIEDKQSIYDQLTDVYHSSMRETWGYIKAECELTGTRFHGNNTSDAATITNKRDIVDMWKKEFEI